MSASGASKLHGVMAEFHSARALIRACERTHEAGYRKVDAYTPYPIEEVFEALHLHRSKVPLLVLVGGILGCIGGFALCYWTSVIEYPMNVGGRPFNSWPAFIPVTFETTILVASFFAVVGMLALNGLPMPYHPVFNVKRFALASRDRYFLIIESGDSRFDPEETRRFLASLEPTEVFDVDP